MRRRRIGNVVSSTHAAVRRVFVHPDWASPAALGRIRPALVSTSNELRFATRKYSVADNLTAKEKELTSLSLLEIKERLDNGSNTCEEIVSACIKQRQNIQALNAFITTVPEDELLHSSLQADQRRKSRKDVRVLEGVPLAFKDVFCTSGVRTTCGSAALKDFVPPYDATVIKQLTEKGGALNIGKTNMDEFSMGSANLSSNFGLAINPWSKDTKDGAYVPGGSSGGSAIAVAANTCYGALGSDTGGSVRLPASYCGIVGLKPSYGRTSRWGLIAYASSLDCPGILAKTVKDAALLLELIAGVDTKDSTSMTTPVPRYLDSIKDNLKGLTVGIPKEYMVAELDSEIKQVWAAAANALQAAGAKIQNISLPHTQYALPAYYILAPAEASSNLARYDGVRYGHRTDLDYSVASMDDMYSRTRYEAFGEEVRRRILLGTFTLSRSLYESYYKKAQQIRKLVHDDFQKAFQEVDVILHPTAPTAAFPVKESGKSPVDMYVNDVMTIPASMAGLPAISVPTGFSKREGQPLLPLGMQLVGRDMDEGTLLNVAHNLMATFTQERK